MRPGWTTGACATAAAKSAFIALVTGEFPDPIEITLPKGQTVAFALAHESAGDGYATAGIIKDAGDDPDVTHGALIKATVRPSAIGSGITFKAGEGVGTVTKPGLPIEPGNAAINPVPRMMIQTALEEARALVGGPGDVEVEVSIPGGAEMAAKTWNPRLGIVGGLSILGTTGIVTPYSCSAWIHSIHRGIDVARATGLTHVAAATGSTSEAAVAKMYGLPEHALIDMGDFAGGMLKYIRAHPLPQLTIGGGFGKLSKLAQGHLDLHSGRSQVDFNWFAEQVGDLGASADVMADVRGANTAMQVLEICQKSNLEIADHVAKLSRQTALDVLSGAQIKVEIQVFNRKGKAIGRCDA